LDHTVDNTRVFDGWSLDKFKYRKLVVEAVFKAYTPYMGGDFRTATIEELDNGSFYIQGYPTAKQLLGRMKWLLRAAIGAYTIREAELEPKVASIPCTEGRGRKQAELSLAQLLFGATTAQEAPCPWKGILSLQVEPLKKLVNTRDKLVEIDFLKTAKRDRPGRRISLILGNNRFSLITQGSYELSGNPNKPLDTRPKSGKPYLDPIKPDNVTFKAMLFMDIDRLKSDSVRLYVDRLVLVKLAAGLLLTTPTVLGLGKAANRGFGRFIARDVKVGNILDGGELDIAELLKNLGEECARGLDNCRRMVSRILDWLRTEVENIKKLAGVETGSSANKIGRAPNLNAVEVEARVFNRQMRDVSLLNSAIEAIGVASTKAKWKQVLRPNMRPHVWPGLNVHTEFLGLPRSQKFPGGCAQASHDRKIVEDPRLRTGYRIIAGNNVGLEICIGHKLVRRIAGDCQIIGVDDLDIGDGRRQSMVIAFPAPSPDRGYRNEIPIIAILFKSLDMIDLFTGKRGRLYHSGPFNVRNKNKPCATILVDVAHAAKSRDGFPRQKQLNPFMGHSKKGGFYTLHGPVQLNLASPGDYIRALREAFEIFLRAL